MAQTAHLAFKKGGTGKWNIWKSRDHGAWPFYTSPDWSGRMAAPYNLGDVSQEEDGTADACVCEGV